MEDYYNEQELEAAETEVVGEDKKKKSNKDNKKKNSKLPIFIGGGAVAIIFGIIAYWLLISAEDSLLGKYDKTTVFVLSCDVAKGTQLTDASIFKKESVDTKTVPGNAITDLSRIKNAYAVCTLGKNTIVTDDMFYSINKAENGTREISFAVGNLSGSVNGTIRASDYIDMYVIINGNTENIKNDSSPNPNKDEMTDKISEDDKVTVVLDDNLIGYTEDENVNNMASNTDNNAETKVSDVSLTPTYKHLYVSKVYTSEGVEIKNNDKTSIATRFTIVVPEADANYIIGAFTSNNTVIYATKWTDAAVLDSQE